MVALRARLAALLAYLRRPPLELDVAIVMLAGADGEGATVACVMKFDDYYRLSQEWKRAVALKAFGPVAGCYWMTVGGQPTHHGLMLTNIESLTAVPIVPAPIAAPSVQTESVP